MHTVVERVPVIHGNSFSLNFLMCKMRIIKSALCNSIKLLHLNPNFQKGMEPQFFSEESKTETAHQVAVLPWTGSVRLPLQSKTRGPGEAEGATRAASPEL